MSLGDIILPLDLTYRPFIVYDNGKRLANLYAVQYAVVNLSIFPNWPNILFSKERLAYSNWLNLFETLTTVGLSVKVI